MESTDLNIESLLETIPVIPVLTIPDAAKAVPLARALAAGGLQVLEVTLRSDDALESIRRIVAEVPEVTVGAGTVTRPEDLDRVAAAGARFAVSPGLTPRLAAAAGESGLPFLPGVMTASEAMAARDQGFSVLKLFPAIVAGGTVAGGTVAGGIVAGGIVAGGTVAGGTVAGGIVAGGLGMLKALGGPLPDLRFCPTGGLTAENFRDFLALPNVVCVGGSWVAPWAAVVAGDWSRITSLARQATDEGAVS